MNRTALGAPFRFLVLSLLLGLGFLAALPRSAAQTPVITEQPPLVVSASLGEPATISIQVNSPDVVTLWFFNGGWIKNVTGNTLTIPAVSLANAGAYTARVQSVFGDFVVSRACVLDVVGATGGWVDFNNFSLKQPVFDEDGVTPLAGDTFLVQLYAGPTESALTPVGAAVPFRSGSVAGYWRGGFRTITTIEPGNPAYVQVRVWQFGRGQTFEEALTLGGKLGASATLYLPFTGGRGVPPGFPVPLTGLTSFRVSSGAAPSITKQPTAVSQNVGGTFELRVTAASVSPPTYQWQQNEVDIPGAISPVLQIQNATKAHAGNYRVIVRNQHGSVTSLAVPVAIVAPPSFVQQPAPVEVVAGAPASFSVGVQGDEPFSYQWRKGESNIPGANSSSYQIPSAQPSDAATYSVVISNVGGTRVSDGARLTVITTPTITTPPANTTSIAGAPLRLNVAVSGGGALSYQWEFNGRPIPGATSSELVIASPTVEHSGCYRVRVSNVVGSTLSRFAVVVIDAGGGTLNFNNVALGAKVTDLDGVTPLAGDNYLAQLYAGPSPFELQPVPGASPFGADSLAGFWRPGLRIVHFLNPGAVAYLQVRVWETSAGPTFNDAIAAGRPTGLSQTFQVALGGLGSPPTLPSLLDGLTPFSLAQWSAPSLTASPASTDVALGARLELRVVAAGSAPFLYRWFHENTLLNVSGPVLEFPAASQNHAGSYRVEVQNWLGTKVSDTAVVRVVTPPAIVAHPQPASALPGGTVQFQAQFSGTEPLSYQWTHEGQDIPGATQPSYSIPAVAASHAGNYAVRANNLAGTAQSNPALLTVASPPQFSQQPVSITVLAGQDATFSAAATGLPTPHFTWFRNNSPIPESDAPTLVVPKVLITDNATFFVRASNAAGNADSQPATLTVVTPPILEQSPVSQVAKAGDTVTFKVVASGTPTLQFAWTHNGNPLPNTSDQLVLASVAAEHAGRYQVRITNPHGFVETPEFTLDLDTPLSLEGTAIDGYIAGATVFFDANRNGKLDSGEPFTLTDAQGRFALDIPVEKFDLNRNGRIDPNEGRLVRFGGVDIATGLAADVPAVGPVGAEVLGPLSSLVDAVQSAAPNLSVQDAEKIVANSLNLPENLPLTRIDPIAAAVSGNAAAPQLINAAAQVQDTLVQLVSVLSGPSGPSDTAAQSVLQSIAQSLTGPSPIPLTEPAAITQILNQSATREGVQVPAAVVDAAAQVVAEGNQSKQEATQSGSPLEIAQLITRIQSVAQGKTADDLADAAAGLKSSAEVIADNTGATLVQQVAAAAVGDLLGTDLRAGTFAVADWVPRYFENGRAIQPLTLVRSDGNQGAVRVRITLASDSALANVDFKPADLFLDFADGELSKTVDLTPVLLDDDSPESTKILVATLRLAPGAPAAAKLGAATTARVQIENDDDAGSFEFSSDALEIIEDGAFVRRLFVERRNGLKGTVHLQVSLRSNTGPASATANVDFNPTPIPLEFAPGQRIAQIVVPVVPDDVLEETESAQLELALVSPIAPGATLGQRQSARLMIIDDPNRVPKIDVVTVLGDLARPAHLKVLGTAGLRLSIQTSLDLKNWSGLPDAQIGADGSYTVPIDRVAPPDQGRFFRFTPKR